MLNMVISIASSGASMVAFIFVNHSSKIIFDLPTMCIMTGMTMVVWLSIGLLWLGISVFLHAFVAYGNIRFAILAFCFDLLSCGVLFFSFCFYNNMLRCLMSILIGIFIHFANRLAPVLHVRPTFPPSPPNEPTRKGPSMTFKQSRTASVDLYKSDASVQRTAREESPYHVINRRSTTQIELENERLRRQVLTFQEPKPKYNLRKKN